MKLGLYTQSKYKTTFLNLIKQNENFDLCKVRGKLKTCKLNKEQGVSSGECLVGPSKVAEIYVTKIYHTYCHQKRIKKW